MQGKVTYYLTLAGAALVTLVTVLSGLRGVLIVAEDVIEQWIPRREGSRFWSYWAKTLCSLDIISMSFGRKDKAPDKEAQ